MVIHDNIYFHNVAELQPAPGGGLSLHRFPKAVRNDPCLTPGGHAMTRMAAKCELRFFGGPLTRLFLRGIGEHTTVTVYRGDLLVTGQPVQLNGTVKEFELQIPAIENAAQPGIYPRGRYPRDLWRVVCRTGELVYHGIDGMGTEIQPPSTSNQPATRLLAYGSSITMAMQNFNGYVEVAAEELGWDSYNLGLAGSCRIEQSIADWISERDDWDVALFELGANMIGTFAPEEFERRTRYLIGACQKNRPGASILLVSIPHFSADARIIPDLGANHTTAYRQILEILQRECNYDGNLHVVDGRELSSNYRGYRADLNHPADAAYFRMGMHLAKRLRQVKR